MPNKLTRRDVRKWLDQLNFQLDQLMRAPAGEFRARIGLLQRRVAKWKEQLSGDPKPPRPGRKR